MKVTLEFDNHEAASNFIGWWMDGGGEQGLDFDTVILDLEKSYLRVKGTGQNPETEEEE